MISPSWALVALTVCQILLKAVFVFTHMGMGVTANTPLLRKTLFYFPCTYCTTTNAPNPTISCFLCHTGNSCTANNRKSLSYQNIFYIFFIWILVTSPISKVQIRIVFGFTLLGIGNTTNTPSTTKIYFHFPFSLGLVVTPIH